MLGVHHEVEERCHRIDHKHLGYSVADRLQLTSVVGLNIDAFTNRRRAHFGSFLHQYRC